MSHLRLESGRRPITSPLNLSSSVNSAVSPPPLLYDLPQPSGIVSPTPRTGSRRPSASRSPPPTISRHRARNSIPLSPTTPPFGALAFSSGTSASPASVPQPHNRRTPPPSRPLSTSGSHELEVFGTACRAWYFQQDAAAGQQMEAILAKIPSSQRAQFSRLQAQIRSSYHTALALRRASEFHAYLSSTKPGQSLTPAARVDPHSSLARRERLERMAKFIQVWAVGSVPGTKPFFDALWALLRLQSLPEYLGGAGGFRMQWVLDDAVFRESAGKEFMLEAVDVLKGVLGFEESGRSKPGHRSTPSSSTKLAQSAPGSSPKQTRQHRPTLATIASTTTLDNRNPIGDQNEDKDEDNANRPRAPSDPFADAHGQRTPMRQTMVSDSPFVATSPRAVAPLRQSEDFELETGVQTRAVVHDDDDDEYEVALLDPARSLSGFRSRPGTPGPGAGMMDDDEEAEYRVWTAPDLPDPDILDLLRLFPSNIGEGTLPRFLGQNTRRKLSRGSPARRDLEAQDSDGEEQELRFGTGKLRMSSFERSVGWQGGTWDRLVGWWRKVFC